MDKTRKYKDIQFYEGLELLASLHRPVNIVFRSENGARTIIRDRIASLFVQEGQEGQEGQECLRTDGGLVIGLDRLEEVDGLGPSGASC
jgi:hypothetical protein